MTVDDFFDALKLPTVRKFDQFIDKHWPDHLRNAQGVHSDCSKLDDDGTDCLDRSPNESDWCESCKTYNDLAGKFYDENPDA